MPPVQSSQNLTGESAGALPALITARSPVFTSVRPPGAATTARPRAT